MAVLGFALGPGPVASAGASSFVQVQRVNSLSLQTTTDTFAPHNALGVAVVGTAAQSALQTGINSGIQDGSISWLLDFSQLTDLSGTNNSTFNVGLLDGMPQEPAGNPTSYNGGSDLDWWYTASPAEVSANGAPLLHLPATFSSGTFKAGPGTIRFNINFAGSALTLAISSLRIQATSGASSAPTESTNGFPPGHLPAEHLNPALTSFESMTSGEFAGNISAQSLAEALVSSALTGSHCDNFYTTSNTWLDVLVSGCTAFTVLPEITPTQPDQVTPGHSGSYAFTVDSNHHVTGCTHNGTADTLADCLAGAAYSGYFHFTTDRVILHGWCAPGFYSSDGYAPCTPCPAGKTSLTARSTSCNIFITTTAVRCAGNSAVIGVATTCTATVADKISGPVATGKVSWSRPPGGGRLSAGSCALVASAGHAICSVRYTPAPGKAGRQPLGAKYAGDSQHTASSHQFSLTVIRRSTSIAVSCRPKTLVHGKSTICSATVADTSPGIAVTPRGKVKWSAPSRDGTFGSASCALAFHNGARRCSVSFRSSGKARGQFSLTATYLGDPSHKGRTGSAGLDVT